jgi:hypothetical protein
VHTDYYNHSTASAAYHHDPRGEFSHTTIELTTDLFRPGGTGELASYSHILYFSLHELMHAYVFNHDKEYGSRDTEIAFAQAAGWNVSWTLGPLMSNQDIINASAWSSRYIWELETTEEYLIYLLAMHIVTSPGRYATDYARSNVAEDFAETATLFALHWLCTEGYGDACTAYQQMPSREDATTFDLGHSANMGRVRWMEEFFGRPFQQ